MAITKRKKTPAKKKNPAKKKMPVMFGYHVIDHSVSTTTRESSDNGEWDRGDTETTHSIKGLTRARDDEYSNLAYNLELDSGDSAWLVFVIYSTGDSFGNDDGQCLMPIALFDSCEKAERCVVKIEKNEKDYQTEKLKRSMDAWTVEYRDNCGIKRSFSAAWRGYFESLDSIEVEQVKVLSARQAKRWA